MATVRILRSTTAGNTPPSLVSGQIAINEADGKLFYRNGAGAVTQLATGATSLYAFDSFADFPATGTAPAIFVDLTRNKLFRWETSVYVEVGPGVGGIDGGIMTESGDFLTTEGGDPLLF